MKSNRTLQLVGKVLDRIDGALRGFRRYAPVLLAVLGTAIFAQAVRADDPPTVTFTHYIPIATVAGGIATFMTLIMAAVWGVGGSFRMIGAGIRKVFSWVGAGRSAAIAFSIGTTALTLYSAAA